MKKAQKAEVLLLMITVIWGGTFVSIKSALDYTSPLFLMGLRFLTAFILFSLFNRIRFSRLSRKTMLIGFFLGVFMFLGYGLQTIGLNYTSASRSGFITYFYALLTPFLQFFILKKKPFWGNLVGILIAFAGLVLITGGWNGGALNRGDLITLASALFFSIYIVCLDLWSREVDPGVLTSLQMLVTAILAFALMPFFETPFLINSPILWGNILYLSLLGSVVCVFVMTRYQKSLTPTRAAILYSMEPVFSVILAVLILKEVFTPLQVLGSLLILSGVILSELLEIKRETRRTALNQTG